MNHDSIAFHVQTDPTDTNQGYERRSVCEEMNNIDFRSAHPHFRADLPQNPNLPLLPCVHPALVQHSYPFSQPMRNIPAVHHHQHFVGFPHNTQTPRVEPFSLLQQPAIAPSSSQMPTEHHPAVNRDRCQPPSTESLFQAASIAPVQNTGNNVASLQLAAQLAGGLGPPPTTGQLANQSALLHQAAPLPHSFGVLPTTSLPPTDVLQFAGALATRIAPRTSSAPATGHTPLEVEHSHAADVAEGHPFSLNSPFPMAQDPTLPLMPGGALDRLALLSHCANAGRVSDDPLAMFRLACMDMGSVDNQALQRDVLAGVVQPERVCAHLVV